MKAICVSLFAAALAVPAVFAQNDSQAQAGVQKALNGSHFKNVQASVQNGIATLTGTVDVFADKVTADQKVRHVHGVTAIRDEIQVAGSEVPDQELQQKLVKSLAYDLWGEIPVQFQAVAVAVQNGVVTLSGHTAGPIAASDSVAVVANTKGVKDIIDNIQIDPLSNFDNQTRWAEFRAIYGYPMLNQYLMDPQKPIRIQVENGHVTLYGTVRTQAEKDAAGIRANGVPGVFSVTNDLQVANASNEKPAK